MCGQEREKGSMCVTVSRKFTVAVAVSQAATRWLKWRVLATVNNFNNFMPSLVSQFLPAVSESVSNIFQYSILWGTVPKKKFQYRAETITNYSRL